MGSVKDAIFHPFVSIGPEKSVFFDAPSSGPALNFVSAFMIGVVLLIIFIIFIIIHSSNIEFKDKHPRVPAPPHNYTPTPHVDIEIIEEELPPPQDDTPPPAPPLPKEPSGGTGSAPLPKPDETDDQPKPTEQTGGESQDHPNGFGLKPIYNVGTYNDACYLDIVRTIDNLPLMGNEPSVQYYFDKCPECTAVVYKEKDNGTTQAIFCRRITLRGNGIPSAPTEYLQGPGQIYVHKTTDIRFMNRTLSVKNKIPDDLIYWRAPPRTADYIFSMNTQEVALNFLPRDIFFDDSKSRLYLSLARINPGYSYIALEGHSKQTPNGYARTVISGSPNVPTAWTSQRTLFLVVKQYTV